LTDLERVQLISNKLLSYLKDTNDILGYLKGNGQKDTDEYEIIKTMRDQLRKCDVKIKPLKCILQ